MDCENTVASAGRLVLIVVSSGSVLLTLEETVECFFFVAALSSSESLDVNFTLLVILNGDVSASLLVGGHSREHIKHELVVDFYH